MTDPNIYLDLCRAEARAIAAEQKSLQDKADLDYIAAMTGIDIPSDEDNEEVV